MRKIRPVGVSSQNRVREKPMPGVAENTTPAYRQIQNAILRQIEAGKLRSGDAVASERELAKIYNVSLMTARHALAVLEREGMVERRRGAGTFVAPPRVHFNKLMSYTEQMTGRSLPVRTRILSITTVSDAAEIAARLLLPSSTRLLRIERLRRAGDEPFAIETCYLSAADFSSLTREKLERGSLFAALETEYALKISYADEEVDATPADPQLARRLGVPHGFPLLRLHQVIHAASGKPFLYVLGLYRADRHTLHIRRFR
jgi:GntR family transcriptional regulator